MNVVPFRNEHHATPPPIPGGRVLVRPSRRHQNSSSVGPELYSEFFSQPDECRALSKRTLRYPSAYTGKTCSGKTIPHESELKIGGSRVLL
ncbi:hypothetical protein TNCT_658171 [Trichonephila clavata]|uniref:Uncharacterized protein n=1 Tax=Trichonephila clavata TaxID=2740835 RepID=A0A8X6KV12_TRICU|nr:hypothetical protein TNCT_658171 [Trichonephila clavata]